MWGRLALFILRFRWLLSILIAALTVFMGWNASKVQLSYEFSRAIPTDNAKYKAYQEFRKQFVEEGNLLVIALQSGQVYKEDLFNDYSVLINNLKPYAQVVLVGPSRTYGKPVGDFNIPVGDWDIFPVSSRTTNKNQEGNYFDGFALNNTVADGLDKDWGDITETCLASVMKYIGTGAFRMALPEEPYVESPAVTAANKRISSQSFKGMVTSVKF